MLKKRLIPKLQLTVKGGFNRKKPVMCVTRKFQDKLAIGDPVSQAKIYEAQMADEIILLDIDRTNESWQILLNTLEQISEELATPLTVGGGITSLHQVQPLLDRGADKVIVNTALIENPHLIELISNKYGSQCLVVSIDVKTDKDGRVKVWSSGGKVKTEKQLNHWTKEVIEKGAGEILITNIDRDGTGNGLDLRIIKETAMIVKVPLIASGGCGLAKHFIEGFESGAAAIAAGTYFSNRDQNLMQCRSQIANSGIPVRIVS